MGSVWSWCLSIGGIVLGLIWFGILERITQRTGGLEVPRVAEEASGAPVVIPVAATVPPAPTGDDYDNHCLPIFFTWRRKTTTSTDSGN